MKTPITYTPDFLFDPDTIFTSLRNELDWVQVDKVPRKEYYVNLNNTPYTYGTEPFARTYAPQAMHPMLQEVWLELELETATAFEVCFLNMYEDERCQLGWHADDSPEMDDSRPIAIVTVGAVREIWFRENPIDISSGFSSKKLFSKPLVERLSLGHGSLCLMSPGMQDTHQHRIPKADRISGPRISMTFRGIV